MRSRAPANSAMGFTMLEALIAMALVTVAAGVLLQLAASAMRANRDSRVSTLAAVLAAEKLEQLRSLTWTVDVADLGPSPPAALVENTEGFFDFFDGRGASVDAERGGLGAALVRRWSIQPLPDDPSSLVLQVVVLPIADAERAAPRGPNGRHTHLATIKTRRAG